MAKTKELLLSIQETKTFAYWVDRMCQRLYLEQLSLCYVVIPKGQAEELSSYIWEPFL